MADPNRAVPYERLLRWLAEKFSQLMTDATRWEIVICGKGDKYSCKVSVYEDP